MDLQQWICHNLSLNNMVHRGISWPILFGIVASQLWNARNKLVFENQYTLIGLTDKCVSWAINVQSANVRIKSISSTEPHQDRRSCAWKKPPNGWLKLNIDAAIDVNKKQSAAAEVLRDDMGFCVGSFQINLGFCSPLFAELKGILHGLKWARSKGITSLEVESDYKLAISYINDTSLWRGCHQALFWELKELLQLDWNIKCIHALREANYPAH